MLPPGDRYEVIERIGLGGMGELFLAWQVGPAGFRRRCVVKVLRADVAAEDPESAALFLSEAQISSQFHHPNLVTVYDFGRGADTYYLAMEYVVGPTLSGLIKAGRVDGAPLPFEAVAAIVRDVARALEAARAAQLPDGRPLGVVHRDISPSNVLVSIDGLAKLIDFGVARASVSAHRTRTGHNRGKLAYMSPEQLRGLPVDQRSDLFSLGLVLYEALAGQPAFRADTYDELALRAAQLDITPVEELRPQVPQALREVLARLLVAERARRYPSPAALADELERIAPSGSVSTAAVATLVAGSSAWWPARGPRPAPALEPERHPTEISVAHLDGEPTKVRG